MRDSYEVRLSLFCPDGKSHHFAQTLDARDLHEFLIPWREREHYEIMEKIQAGHVMAAMHVQRKMELRKKFFDNFGGVLSTMLESLFRKVENKPDSGPSPYTE